MKDLAMEQNHTDDCNCAPAIQRREVDTLPLGCSTRIEDCVRLNLPIDASRRAVAGLTLQFQPEGDELILFHCLARHT
jgi:hypothetical protein